MSSKFPKMTKSEVLKLVNEVSASLKTIGAAELDRLAKADPGAPPIEGSSASASSGSPEGSSGSASGSPEGSSSEGSSAAAGLPSEGAPPPGAEGSAPPMAPPPGAEGSAPPAAPPAPGAEGAAPAGPSFEELVQLYTTLATSNPQDFEAHVAAIQQAMQSVQGASPAGAGAPPPGASPSAPPAAPPGASPSAPPMGKQEVATHNPNIGAGGTKGGAPGHVETANPNIGPTKKSEVEELGVKLAKAEGDLQALGEVVKTMLTIPQRKAVTGLTIVPMRKSEEPVKSAKKPFGDLTKAELHKALTVATDPRSNKLTKSERDVVTDFILSPASVDLTAIESIYNKV